MRNNIIMTGRDMSTKKKYQSFCMVYEFPSYSFRKETPFSQYFLSTFTVNMLFKLSIDNGLFPIFAVIQLYIVCHILVL